jgi:hypothetical protein
MGRCVWYHPNSKTVTSNHVQGTANSWWELQIIPILRLTLPTLRVIFDIHYVFIVGSTPVLPSSNCHNIDIYFFYAFATTVKNTPINSSMSVFPHVTNRESLNGFSQNSILATFTKICTLKFWLNSDKKMDSLHAPTRFSASKNGL